MRDHKITLEQSILNTVNAKQDFTYSGNKKLHRYVVSFKNIHTSKNPSLKLENGLTVIRQALDKINKPYFIERNGFMIDADCIGGWNDKDTDEYFLDLNSTFANKKEALIVAKAFNQIAIFDTKKEKVIFVK